MNPQPQANSDRKQNPAACSPRWAGIALVGLALLAGVLTVVAGCGKSRPSRRTAANPEDVHRQTNQLFVYAIEHISRDQNYDAGEAFLQAMDRLDQWVRQQGPPPDWKLDPLAAPLFAAFGEFFTGIKPIHAQWTEARTALELKAVARQLERVPDRLEELSRRRNLADLEALGQQYEQTNRNIETAVKQGGDATQREELEARIVEAFLKRLKDPKKQSRFKELVAVAQLLDDPSRLTDVLRLGELGLRLESLRQPDPNEAAELVAQFDDTAQRFLRGGPPTKLLVELRFLVEQMQDLGRMKDYVELLAVVRVLDTLAEQLRTTANRANRDDLRGLAMRFAAAGRKRDLDALRGLEGELVSLARPHDFDDLAALGPRLLEAAAGLAQLGRKAAEQAGPTGLESLKAMAPYCEQLGERVKQVVADMRQMTQTAAAKADRQALATRLTELTDRFDDLAERVATLHGELEYLSGVEQRQFYAQDQSAFREAVFLRDLSRWIRGDDVDDVARAKRIFDWTVRNIQLEATPDPASGVVRVPQFPLETLFLGRGTVIERAWVFVLLARQQGIDAAMLGIPDPGERATQGVRTWAVGVLSEGEIYLFEPRLGFPIPAKDGVRRGPDGAMDFRPATLAQVAADDSLLRRLDLGADRPYPLKASQIQKVVALIDDSPSYLTQRMKLVESQLTGEDRMVLTASPSAQAGRFKAAKHVAEVRLWNVAYQTLLVRWILGPVLTEWQRRVFAPFQAPSLVQGRWISSTVEEPVAPLFLKANPKQSEQVQRRARTSTEMRREAPPDVPLGQGRTLHLRGQLSGESSAAHFYQMARPSERELGLHQGLSADAKALYLEAKQNASYWLGLAAFDQQNYPSAIDYLLTRTLAAFPGTPWTPGVRYNLGRVYEAQGQAFKAAQQYRQNTEAPDAHGNLLRARWLEAQARAAGGKPAETKPGEELPGLPALPALPDKPAAKPTEQKVPPTSKK